uniref:Uncharacterized protein n=1 Tax=Cacopsylla melanoneura TaxID=428564 RepID=A0A8D8LHJ7_9HEMI
MFRINKSPQNVCEYTNFNMYITVDEMKLGLCTILIKMRFEIHILTLIVREREIPEIDVCIVSTYQNFLVFLILLPQFFPPFVLLFNASQKRSFIKQATSRHL